MLTKNCLVCETEFQTKPSLVKKGYGKFCSRKCASSTAIHERNPENWVTVECAFCGSRFEKKRSALSGSKSGLYFCNKDCKCNAQRIGGIREIMPSHYGESKTDYSFARKDFCEMCGYNNYPIHHVHHIDRNKQNNSPDNLICLCPNCHSETHYIGKDGMFSQKFKNMGT